MSPASARPGARRRSAPQRSPPPRSRPGRPSSGHTFPGGPMTDAATTRRTPRPRGEGQWALGYHEPLNAAEQIKKEAEPLDVRERIERIFAPGGFRSIGKQDLRSRMRWWGLYTHRKEGAPRERTGTAGHAEVEDEFFMMRIRIAGGTMTSQQVRPIAWASERYGRD